MNFEGRTVWQQSAGDKDRNYVNVCLDLGIILLGPGDNGHFIDCKQKYEDEVGLTGVFGANFPRKSMTRKGNSILQRFAEKMKDCDIIVLKLGTNEIYGVGEIVGDYIWSEAFSDVDGWNLEHVRRVRWLWKSLEPDVLPTQSLKWGDTTQLLNKKAGLDWLKSKKIQTEKTVDLPDLPSASNSQLSIDEVGQSLFDRGVGGDNVSALIGGLDDMVRLAKWYAKTDEKPSEHETVAQLVVPFLGTLGWTPQKMALEWNRIDIDIALFKSLPRRKYNLSFVIEAKKLNSSCLRPQVQAEEYAKTNNCRRIITTDGIRYAVFEKKWNYKLSAYLNLFSLMGQNPALQCDGAVEAIWLMSPENQS